MAKKLAAAGMQLLVIDTGAPWRGGRRQLPMSCRLVALSVRRACLGVGAVPQLRWLELTLACRHCCRNLRRLPPGRHPRSAENKFVSTGFAEEIAKAAGGKYYYVSRARAVVVWVHGLPGWWHAGDALGVC